MSSYPPLPEPKNPDSRLMKDDSVRLPDSVLQKDEPVILRADPESSAAVAAPAETSAGPEHKPAPIWLQRVSLLVQVMFCVYLGILLVILPWWPRLLETNELLNAFPILQTWLTQGAVRGIISGIGLVDIWIGISEIINYHEVRS